MITKKVIVFIFILTIALVCILGLFILNRSATEEKRPLVTFRSIEEILALAETLPNGAKHFHDIKVKELLEIRIRALQENDRGLYEIAGREYNIMRIVNECSRVPEFTSTKKGKGKTATKILKIGSYGSWINPMHCISPDGGKRYLGDNDPPGEYLDPNVLRGLNQRDLDVLFSLPKSRNLYASGRREQLVYGLLYGDLYVYLENYVVTDWQFFSKRRRW